MEKLIDEIRVELILKGDEEIRKSSQRFFKENVKCYGLRNPDTKRISKLYFKQIASQSKEEIFRLCEMLWDSAFMEEGMIACHWSMAVNKQYEPTDFMRFERWIDSYINNWATCDTFCNHSMGKLIEMYPDHIKGLKKMAVSENRWMRRAAAVSLIVPARKGKFLKDILEITSILLLDQDDMVQKGYGWMLKSASQAHQQEVFEFVLNHKAEMPRTALRYAIEKMPEELKVMAMAKE